MGINSTEVAYGFGQMGSVFNDTANPMKAPTGKVFVAITFLADVSLEAHGGLVAEQDSVNGLEYISTETAAGGVQTAHDIAHDGAATAISGAGGVAVEAAQVFPKGVTIYGRWTEIHPTAAASTGGIIAYIGA